jgi:hypothetical protein
MSENFPLTVSRPPGCRCLQIAMAAAIATCLATLPCAPADAITTYLISPADLFSPPFNTVAEVSGSFEYDPSNSTYVTGTASITITGASGQFAVANGSYNELANLDFPSITFSQSSPATPDDLLTIDPLPTIGSIDIYITVRGPGFPTMATVDECCITAVPAPVAGAGIPGLLAGVGAFLFWRGRSTVHAFVLRRQRSRQRVTS